MADDAVLEKAGLKLIKQMLAKLAEPALGQAPRAQAKSASLDKVSKL